MPPVPGSEAHRNAERRARRMTTIPGIAGDIIKSTRWNAQRRGVPHTIDKAYLVKLFEEQNNACSVTGIKFDTNTTSRRKSPFSPTLDRRDPSQGYTKENVHLVCMIYNYAKNAYSFLHVMTLADALVNRHGHAGK